MYLPSLNCAEMSSYDKFLAFEEITKERFPKDVITKLFKVMKFTRAELKEKHTELRTQIDELEFDASDEYRYVKEQITDAKRELDFVVGFAKVKPDSDAYKTRQNKIETLEQASRDARAQYRAKIGALKKTAQRVKEDHNAL